MDLPDSSSDDPKDQSSETGLTKSRIVFWCIVYSLLVVVLLFVESKTGILSKMLTAVVTSISDYFSKPSYDPGMLPTPTR
jgi:hypothetical protein